MWIETDYEATNTEFVYKITLSGKVLIFHSAIPVHNPAGTTGGNPTLTTEWSFDTPHQALAAYDSLMADLKIRKKSSP